MKKAGKFLIVILVLVTVSCVDIQDIDFEIDEETIDQLTLHGWAGYWTVEYCNRDDKHDCVAYNFRYSETGYEGRGPGFVLDNLGSSSAGKCAAYHVEVTDDSKLYMYRSDGLFYDPVIKEYIPTEYHSYWNWTEYNGYDGDSNLRRRVLTRTDEHGNVFKVTLVKRNITPEICQQ